MYLFVVFIEHPELARVGRALRRVSRGHTGLQSGATPVTAAASDALVDLTPGLNGFDLNFSRGAVYPVDDTPCVAHPRRPPPTRMD